MCPEPVLACARRAGNRERSRSDLQHADGGGRVHGQRESTMRDAPTLAVRSTVNSRRADLRYRNAVVCALVVLIERWVEVMSRKWKWEMDSAEYLRRR